MYTQFLLPSQFRWPMQGFSPVLLSVLLCSIRKNAFLPFWNMLPLLSSFNSWIGGTSRVDSWSEIHYFTIVFNWNKSIHFIHSIALWILESVQNVGFAAIAGETSFAEADCSALVTMLWLNGSLSKNGKYWRESTFLHNGTRSTVSQK